MSERFDFMEVLQKLCHVVVWRVDKQVFLKRFEESLLSTNATIDYAR